MNGTIPLIPPGMLANASIEADATKEGRVYVRMPGSSAAHGLTLGQALQLSRDLRNAIDIAAGYQHDQPRT